MHNTYFLSSIYLKIFNKKFNYYSESSLYFVCLLGLSSILSTLPPTPAPNLPFKHISRPLGESFDMNHRCTQVAIRAY